MALSDSRLPRTEVEQIAGSLHHTRGDTAGYVARLVADPAEHPPQRVLTRLGIAAAKLSHAGAQWEARLSEPPPAVSRRGHQGRPLANLAAAPQRVKHRERRATSPAEAVRRFAALPEVDVAQHVGVIREAIAVRTTPTAELVPWLGRKDRELVLQAKRRLRPPGGRQVSCSLRELRWGSRPVERARQLAAEESVALLRVVIEQVERDDLVTAFAALSRVADDPAQFALLGISPFAQREGGTALSGEILVVQSGGIG